MFHFRQGEKRVDTMEGLLEFGRVAGTLVSEEKIQIAVEIRIQEMIHDSGIVFWGLSQG